jgi:hypothetical protein
MGNPYLWLRRPSATRVDRRGMKNFADVLTVLAAGGGLGVLLVMAAVPLLLDRDHRSERAPVRRPAGGRAAPE